MRYVKWLFIICFWTLVAGIFHYTLPQKDIVRITDTYAKRIDFGENSIFWASSDVGNAEAVVNRDVFFIQTRRANDSIMVYRNEDTGWGWPPYFKFDTSNLQAEAADLVSSLLSLVARFRLTPEVADVASRAIYSDEMWDAWAGVERRLAKLKSVDDQE